MKKEYLTNYRLIRKLRTDKNISLKDFANEVGISRNYLSEIELGTAKKPRKVIVKRICEVLGVKEDIFLNQFSYISNGVYNKHCNTIIKRDDNNTYQKTIVTPVFDSIAFKEHYDQNKHLYITIDDILYLKDEYENIEKEYENWINEYSDKDIIEHQQYTIDNKNNLYYYHNHKEYNVYVVYSTVKASYIVYKENNNLEIVLHLHNLPLQDYTNVQYELLKLANNNTNVTKTFGINPIIKKLESKISDINKKIEIEIENNKTSLNRDDYYTLSDLFNNVLSGLKSSLSMYTLLLEALKKDIN